MLRASRGVLLVACATLLAAACRTGIAYVGDDVPAYSGTARAPRVVQRGDTVRIVAFNIKYAQYIDRAVEVLRSEPGLRDADVLLLQEMNDAGARAIAEALRMHWVYYPAIHHIRTGRDFGNAVLTRWPIVQHERILLPHVGRFTGTRRAATAATLDVNGRLLRVYSVHLATIVEAGPRARADQLCAVADDAARFAHAVIGGDLNSSLVAEALDPDVWVWPTARGRHTSLAGRLDHILLMGMADVPGGVEVVRNVRGASDHHPLWVDAVFER